jgi:hypothetical protein
MMYIMFGITVVDKYARITVIHCDFLKATKYSFYKIMISHRNFDTFIMIPNIDNLINMHI